MDFGNLFLSLDGRINRAKFWLGAVILLVAQWIFMLVAGLLFGGGMMDAGDPSQPPSMAALLPLLIIILLFLWPSICLYAKRWHDRDKSGWWTLIILVPIVGSIWMLVECGLLAGTDGPNRFGNDPLAS